MTNSIWWLNLSVFPDLIQYEEKNWFKCSTTFLELPFAFLINVFRKWYTKKTDYPQAKLNCRNGVNTITHTENLLDRATFRSQPGCVNKSLEFTPATIPKLCWYSHKISSKQLCQNTLRNNYERNLVKVSRACTSFLRNWKCRQTRSCASMF